MISRAGMPGAGSGDQTGDIARPMLAGAEEKRADDDPPAAATDTPIKSGGDGRLGQFHVSRLNDGVSPGKTPAKGVGHLLQQLIGFCNPRSVVHDDDSRLHDD